jgi:chromate reductase
MVVDPHRVDIAEIRDLPLYDRDIETAGMPDSVSALRATVAGADGLIIATPEYNHSIPGGLKNALDWLSRAPFSPLDHLPVAVLGGASLGGSARAQDHVRQVLVHNRSAVLDSPQVMVSRVWDAFDESLVLTDEEVRRALEALVQAFERRVLDDIAQRPAVLAVGVDRAAARELRPLAEEHRLVAVAGVEAVGPAVERWQPVAVIAADTAGMPDTAAPVIALGDPATLAPRLASAIARR